MKIRIAENGKEFTMHLPSGLILNRFVIRMALKSGDCADAIPAGAAAKLIGELNRIRKIHGSWELVEVNSADGERVTVTL